MSARKIKVDLFYDVISPYAWITFEALTRYSNVWKSMDLRLNPILLGVVFKAVGTSAPIPARSKYSKVDLRLMTDYYNLPFRRPENVNHVLFGKGSLQPQRLLTAVRYSAPGYLEPLSRDLFLRIWSKDLDATSPSSLASSCHAVGISSDRTKALLRDMSSDGIKTRLKETTALALEHGAFGVPTYVVHLDTGPVMLFGSDRLFILAHMLCEHWPGALNELRSVKKSL